MTLRQAMRTTGRGLAHAAGAAALTTFVAWAAVASQTCTEPPAGATLARLLPAPPAPPACHLQARLRSASGG